MMRPAEGSSGADSHWFSQELNDMMRKEISMQTAMGLIQMTVKMNEALAKVFRALGDSIKGLA